jgi:hypothetical protein
MVFILGVDFTARNWECGGLGMFMRSRIFFYIGVKWG